MSNFWYPVLKIKFAYSFPVSSLLLANRNHLISVGAAEKTVWRGRGGYDDDEVEGIQISGE